MSKDAEQNMKMPSERRCWRGWRDPRRGQERETEKAGVGTGGLYVILTKLSFRPPCCHGPLPKPGKAPAVWSVSFFLKRASQVAEASDTHRCKALGTL